MLEGSVRATATLGPHCSALLPGTAFPWSTREAPKGLCSIRCRRQPLSSAVADSMSSRPRPSTESGRQSLPIPQYEVSVMLAQRITEPRAT